MATTHSSCKIVGMKGLLRDIHKRALGTHEFAQRYISLIIHITFSFIQPASRACFVIFATAV